MDQIVLNCVAIRADPVILEHRDGNCYGYRNNDGT